MRSALGLPLPLPLTGGSLNSPQRRLNLAQPLAQPPIDNIVNCPAKLAKLVDIVGHIGILFKGEHIPRIQTRLRTDLPPMHVQHRNPAIDRGGETNCPRLQFGDSDRRVSSEVQATHGGTDSRTSADSLVLRFVVRSPGTRSLPLDDEKRIQDALGHVRNVLQRRVGEAFRSAEDIAAGIEAECIVRFGSFGGLRGREGRFLDGIGGNREGDRVTAEEDVFETLEGRRGGRAGVGHGEEFICQGGLRGIFALRGHFEELRLQVGDFGAGETRGGTWVGDDGLDEAGDRRVIDEGAVVVDHPVEFMAPPDLLLRLGGWFRATGGPSNAVWTASFVAAR